jgi:hypothetical protein
MSERIVDFAVLISGPATDLAKLSICKARRQRSIKTLHSIADLEKKSVIGSYGRLGLEQPDGQA